MYATTIAPDGTLHWTEVPDPTPAPGEVLVRIEAAAVNRADLLQAAGKYPPPPGAPPYPGLECAGTRADTGEPVCALLAGGGYAELVAVPGAQLLPVPAGLDAVGAAALPEVACTVWSTVVKAAGLRYGETLLVHGGGSGIGTFAIQLAAALGARVLTTARAPKHDRLRALGAHRVIDHTVEDFVEVARADGGVDVVLDIIGGPYLDRNVAALRTGGRVAVIGLQGGRTGELDLGALLARRATVLGTTLRSRSAAEKAAIVAGVREQVWPLVAAGRVRPVVDRVLPVAAAAEAHRVLAGGEHVGKVVLAVRGV
ncbi:NAD(P)H quinone oxidoreductase [Pilimelia anulata]|uniref:NAD(P)H quinone oxidoreductase n=1 Tax=Pilimelia anulata TaxID=53371 RepID=A0A8J3BIG2_9ACTN|nr:NAD(P)H-quinone oxidoreductase [Pilimelia anulata]GGK10918.1 NAD(P)H quinone oxidoreductase [Pilimelia anulata]